MKKLWWLLLLPVTIVFAAPQSIKVSWDPYPNPQATIHVECQVNGGAFAGVGTTPASSTSLDVTVQANGGDTVACRAFATQSGFQDSARSGVASLTLPLPVLPAPTGVRVAL